LDGWKLWLHVLGMEPASKKEIKRT